MLVDVRKTKSAKAADLFIQIKPRKDFEALWALRALAKGVELDAAEIEAETGVPLATWQALMERMKQAKYGVILFGMGLTMTRGKHLNSYALLALTRDMNAYTRFVCKPMRGHGNVTGADNVVTWRTGYPFGVNLARGYPRFNPGEYTTTDTLGRGEADAALIIASDPMSNFTQAAREHLARIPYIALDPKDTPTTEVRDGRLPYGHLRNQHPRHRLSNGRCADPPPPRLRVPLPQRLRSPQGIERRVRELTAGQRVTRIVAVTPQPRDDGPMSLSLRTTWRRPSPSRSKG